MPEQRNNERMAHAELSGGRFFIRRADSPAAIAAAISREPRPRRNQLLVSNQENDVPLGAVRPTQRRRSPLPEWYPRRPLGDITAILKAVEKKNCLREAAARQQRQRHEEYLQSGQHATPTLVEYYVPHCASAPDCLGTSSVQGELKPSSSPSGCSLQTPSRLIDPALTNRIEKELSTSIDQLEKIVRRNLERTTTSTAVAQSSKSALQRRMLMSLR